MKTTRISDLFAAFFLGSILVVAANLTRAAGVITPVSARILNISLSAESPKRTAFVRGSGVQTLAVYDLSHTNVLPVTVGSFFVWKSPSLQNIYFIVNGMWIGTETLTSPDGTEVAFANLNTIVETMQRVSVKVVGFINNNEDYRDVSTSVWAISHNADYASFPATPTPTHAVIEAKQDEGISNLSVTATVTPQTPATMGFVVRGDQFHSYPVLVRAIGPTLAKFGVTNPMSDPLLNVYDSERRLVVQGVNDDWDFGLSEVFQSVGAFALPKGSADSATVLYLPPGSYTTSVKGFGTGSGQVLIEVYQLPQQTGAKG